MKRDLIHAEARRRTEVELMSESTDGHVCLLMTRDVLPGQEQNHFEFVITEFCPGPEPSWILCTMYGDGPLVLTGTTAPGLKTLHRMPDSPNRERLKRKLLDHVTSCREKNRAGQREIPCDLAGGGCGRNAPAEGSVMGREEPFVRR